MCDVSKTRFFRPWNGDVVVQNQSDFVNDTTSSTSKVTAVTSAMITTIKREENDVDVDVDIKRCDTSVDEDEDNESVLSCMSVATSGTGSYPLESRSNRETEIARRQSVSSSSCSLNSCEDLPEAGSLDMLSNFVFGTRSEVESGRSMSNGSMGNCNGARHCAGENGSSNSNSGSSSSSETSSFASRDSPQSAFTPTSYQSPVYSAALDYLAPLRVGLVSPETAAAAAAAAAATFEAGFNAHHSHHHGHLLYGIPGLPIASYGNSVEEAVKFIHQQDAAAKQMKKLRPKKFRCEHCDVAFSNNGQLKGHVRIHTGERPFKCDSEGCGKSFTRNEELTRHKRIHTGLRPHSCILCGKRFGRKDHLKKHTRTHDNRTAYHIPPSALGPFALGHHPLPPGHPMSPYIYPI